MAKFPDNPKIGQAFLSDPASLYVWSGYQWILSSGRYGYFYDQITQTAVANTATPVRLRSTDLSRDVSVESDSSGDLTQIHFSDRGKYNIAFSLQLDRVASSGTVAVVIWLRKNEIDIPWSSSQITLSGNANVAKAIPAWNFFVDITDPSDYVQLMWRTPDANIQIVAFAANSAQPSPTAYPATPSAILSVNQVGY
jgi:hypothetical protein